MRRPDRLNRSVLALIGTVLIAASAYGLARRYGAFGTSQQHQPLLWPDVRTFVAGQHDWVWWAAAGASAAIAFLALAWLRAQLRLPRPANENLDRVETDGITRVKGAAAADALANDIDRLPGVASVAARVWGDPKKPEVHLRVQLHDDAALEDLRSRIETEYLDRLRQSLQVDRLDGTVDLRLADALGRTVR